MKRCWFVFVLIAVTALGSALYGQEPDKEKEYPFDYFRDIVETLPENQNYIFRTVPREFILNRLIVEPPQDSVFSFDNIWPFPDDPEYFEQPFVPVETPSYFKNEDGTMTDCQYFKGIFKALCTSRADTCLITTYLGKGHQLKLSLIIAARRPYFTKYLISAKIYNMLARSLPGFFTYLETSFPYYSAPLDAKLDPDFELKEPPSIKKLLAKNYKYILEGIDIPVCIQSHELLQTPFYFILSDALTDTVLAMGIFHHL